MSIPAVLGAWAGVEPYDVWQPRAVVARGGAGHACPEAASTALRTSLLAISAGLRL